MVRLGFFCFFLIFFSQLRSQEEKVFLYPGMLKGTATITPGFLIKQTQTDLYINGDLEYFPEDKLSVRGDVFWMVGSQQKPSLLQQNSALFFGALYHFHKNRFDCFVGFQPGISLCKPSDTQGRITNPQSSVLVTYTSDYTYKLLPNFSPVTGITFYASNYFNFFLNVRYVFSRYFGYENAVLNLDEFRISAGLGFQIHTVRKNRT